MPSVRSRWLGKEARSRQVEARRPPPLRGCGVCELAKGSAGGAFAYRYHAVDGCGGWQVTCNRDFGMDQDIGVPDGGVIVARINALTVRMGVVDAQTTEH